MYRFTIDIILYSLSNPSTEIVTKECSAYGASTQHLSNTATSLPNPSAEITISGKSVLLMKPIQATMHHRYKFMKK